MHEDDMDRFVEEQKAKLAEERRNLEMNPTSAVSGYYADQRNSDPKNQVNGRDYNEASTQQKAFVDNNPPVTNRRPQTPKIFKLGEDYQQFRNQLNQQRQREYEQQLNKKKPVYQSNPYQNQQPQESARPALVQQKSDLGLSLPIRDHLSAQERLRRERNREYNELLQRNQKRRRDDYQPPPVQPQQLQQTNNYRPKDNLPPPAPRPQEVSSISVAGRRREPIVAAAGQRPYADDTYALAARREAEARELAQKARLETDEYVKAKRREIDTYTESVQKRLEADEYAIAKKREADEYARAKKREAESYQELLERKRLEERLYRKDEDPVRGGADYPVRRRPRRRRQYYDDGYDDDDDYYDALDEELYHRLKNRRPRVIRIEDDDDGSSLATPPVRKDAPRSDRPRKNNSAEGGQRSSRRNIPPETYDASYDTPAEVRSKSAPPEQEFTGLPIGERENYGTSKLSKKEQYRRELEQQMRENQQKKINDKNRDQSEDRDRERQVAGNDEYTKPKRVTYADERVDDDGGGGGRTYRAPPTAAAPVQANDLVSPHDQAYFYYGTRNPLDPSFGAGVPPGTSSVVGASYPPITPLAPNTQSSNARNSTITPGRKSGELVVKSVNGSTGLFLNDGSQDSTKQQKAQSYQEELRRQVEDKRREKELRKAEEERYDRRKDAEAREYNPWGKGGGGAPMRDVQGNLVSKRQGFDPNQLTVDDQPLSLQQNSYPQEEEGSMKLDEQLAENTRADFQTKRQPSDDAKFMLHQQPYTKRPENNPNALTSHQNSRKEPMSIDEQLAANSIADLRSMRQTNDDFGQNPSKYQQQQDNKPLTTSQPISSITPRYNPDSTDPTNTPRLFGRSNPFENKETAQQKSQKDLYKEELQRQIDERKRVEAERKERIRLEEEKEEKRLAEQSRKMQEEFEAEQKRKQDKIEEQKRKNEELQRAIEDQKRAEEQKRRENLSHREDQIREQRERELDDKLKQANTPRQSYQQPISSRKPVIAEGEKIPRTPVGRPPPSNRGPNNGGATYRQATNRQPPTNRQLTNRQQPTNRSERVAARAESPLAAPPRETPRYIYSRDSSRISRELSALRRQLLDEQRRIENQLGNDDDIKINTQIQDLSRLRQRPVQVVRRRPPVVTSNHDFPDQMALKEFNDFKYQNDETSSLRIFKSEYPEQPVDANSLEKQQAELIRNQVRNLEALKSPQRSTALVPVSTRREKSSSPPPIQQLQINNYVPPRTASPNSLLETETTYIPISDDLPPTPQQRQPARERRREDRRDKENSNEKAQMRPQHSMTLNDVELLAGRNDKRLTNLGAEADAISLTDPDDILNQFVNKHQPENSPLVQSLAQSKDSNKRSASITTLESEPWLRPESRTT